MRVHGDVESVNLSTGERHRRVVGDGESRLESLGIPGLQSVKPTDLADYDRSWEDNKSIHGGLIPSPEPNCVHDWQEFSLPTHQGLSVFVYKCSQCHVLGMPPKKAE